jgi:putative addiction module component (TIGR02574 family)
MATLSELAETALRLSLEERAALATTLLESLDEAGAESTEAWWDEESSRRLAAHQAGHLTSVPAEEVRRKAAALFR